MDFVITNDPIVKSSFGITGTSHIRVTYTAAIEGIPKIKTVLKSTFFCMALCTPPTNAVDPTINNEYAVAKTGFTAIT